jgi:hypothetical protein
MLSEPLYGQVVARKMKDKAFARQILFGLTLPEFPGVTFRQNGEIPEVRGMGEFEERCLLPSSHPLLKRNLLV